MPYQVFMAFGHERPRRVASFESYAVARSAAIRRVQMKNPIRQPMYAAVRVGDKEVFEVSRVENPDGSSWVVVDREEFP